MRLVAEEGGDAGGVSRGQARGRVSLSSQSQAALCMPPELASPPGQWSHRLLGNPGVESFNSVACRPLLARC